MSPLILQNIVSSITFILIIGIALLFLVMIIILIRDTSKQQVTYRQLRRLETLESSFKYSPVPSIIIDGNAKILRINKEAAKLFNKPGDELVSTTFEPFLLVASSQTRHKQMIEAVGGDKPFTFEARIPQQKNDLLYDFSVTGLSAANEPRYLITIEPAEEKKRENEMRELLEIRINEVESTTGIGFFVYDFDTAETIWSRGLYELLEMPFNTQKPSLNFFSQFSKDNREDVEQLLLDLKNQQPYSRRLKLDTYKGNRKIVDLTLRHRKGNTRRHQRSLGVLRDVTELEEMRKDNTKLKLGGRFLTEIGGLFYVLTDEDENVHFMGKYAMQALGIDRLSGKKSFKEIFGPSEVFEDSYITQKDGRTIRWYDFEDPDPNLGYTHRVGKEQ